MASRICGCHFYVDHPGNYTETRKKHYLPIVGSEVHATILSRTSKAILKQTFTNPAPNEVIKECIYSFPLFDGVSVVSFTCHIGDKVLKGIVKEKAKAKATFDNAVSNGLTAGLLAQDITASDMFSTQLGNIPPGSSITVEITYVSELKHDAEADGIRLTIPTMIAPRYGDSLYTALNYSSMGVLHVKNVDTGMKITVDAHMADGASIRGIQSPSHPIAVTMGVLSTNATADPTTSKASVSLSLGSTALDDDFILIIQATDVGKPTAVLEAHPTLKGHRALMTTLVPKFSLPATRPEIVFVADRSGSMYQHIPMLISAMKVFLKSMPAGVKFNICSFGSTYSFLWEKSQAYNADSLAYAMQHTDSFLSNMGGTETFNALKATVERRYKDLSLEIILLTDGGIAHQLELFKYINEQVTVSSGKIRVFSLGIGSGVSHALIEGVARAGNGFAQSVQGGERLDGKVVKMLRGALSPHIDNYTLEVNYEADDEFELVDRVTDGLRVLMSQESPSDGSDKLAGNMELDPEQQPISLFDENANPEGADLQQIENYLPNIPIPALLQAPHKIPSLFPFSRTVVYLLMSPTTIQKNPVSITLRATSSHGPLELTIPVEKPIISGETIHQLAARKAVQDLEEGRGWLYDAKFVGNPPTGDSDSSELIKDRYPGRFSEIVEKEAVRLGETFQIAGKWTSFVAVEENQDVNQAQVNSYNHYAELIREQMQASQSCRQSNIVNGIRKRFLRRVDPSDMVQIRDSPSSLVQTPVDNLAAYQQSLMVLQQTNTKRRLMEPAAPGAMPMQQFQTRNINPPPTPSGVGGLADALSVRRQANDVDDWEIEEDDTPEVDECVAGGLVDHEFCATPLTLAPLAGFSSPAPAPLLKLHRARKGSHKPVLSNNSVLSHNPILSNNPVLSLIELQSFDGSWASASKDKILQLIGLQDFSEVDQKDLESTLLLTVLVVTYLVQCKPTEEDVWTLVVEKAKDWVDNQLLIGDGQIKKETLDIRALEILHKKRDRQQDLDLWV
ncbi:hypothetical protein BP6252_12114 [Coleophoma cylindrospora]|uniref:VIT-domain-containing protein n=1 Tax=Coleophoma cylindrospora TaxID=1849047 RepID=A0A3D8QG87_9HELO|nr:hypothetical protein BP6252_12114 [Coleophoma cylindrospora]